MLVCPECRRDIPVRRDHLVRKHSRPVEIPGGLASARCPGSDKPPVHDRMPAWMRDAFGIERG
jgi:hypothetical protein